MTAHIIAMKLARDALSRTSQLLDTSYQNQRIEAIDALTAALAEVQPPSTAEPSVESLGLAAQAWCEPDTAGIVMDLRLAIAFARVLDRQRPAATGQSIGNVSALSGDHDEPSELDIEQQMAEPQTGRQSLCGGRAYCAIPFCACGAPDPLPERDPTAPSENQGLFHKFNVTRTDGSDRPGGKHEGCEYFVLDLSHDKSARAALAAYAFDVMPTHRALALDMISRYDLPEPTDLYSLNLETPARSAEIQAEGRYHVEKSKGGFWPYIVQCGDGTRVLYRGHRKSCDQVAAELKTAFLDGQFVGAALQPSREDLPAPMPICPITGRKFWGNIHHPQWGVVATYGGPFDTYTVPHIGEDGELFSERYDQDAGHWVEGGEPIGWFYVDQQGGAAVSADERNVIEMLLKLAYEAWNALDNSEERVENDVSEFILSPVWYDPLCAALDKMETLPDQPGYTMEITAKARWALRRLLDAAPHEDAQSALSDAVIYGMGMTQGGEHVPRRHIGSLTQYRWLTKMPDELVASMRESFEAWAAGTGCFGLQKNSDGVYTNLSDGSAWAVWQAATAAHQLLRPINCLEAALGTPLCAQCTEGHYERCLKVATNRPAREG